ncbi:hypothetical protein IWX75_003034 [Arthrobacter sp. CAN_A6]|uniref:hypothetical protein n=1 Tax=Arthrobacter sp. CAN_A6 TaxID=2787721 RepID=UPI001A1E7E18
MGRQRHASAQGTATCGTTRAAVSAAVGSYAGNAALGTAVLFGLIDTSRIRWVHHLLYVGTCLTTAVAMLAAAADPHGRRICGALAPAVLPLAVIPFAGTSGRRHPAVALAAAPFYAAALVRVWRSDVDSDVDVGHGG